MDILSYLMGQNSAVKKGMKVEVVTELPATGETNVIYLVPKEDTEENDIFEEYLYVDDEWELIGTTDIDLSGYQPLLTAGENITIENNVISATGGGSSEIEQFKISDYSDGNTINWNDIYDALENNTPAIMIFDLSKTISVTSGINSLPESVVISKGYIANFYTTYSTFIGSIKTINFLFQIDQYNYKIHVQKSGTADWTVKIYKDEDRIVNSNLTSGTFTLAGKPKGVYFISLNSVEVKFKSSDTTSYTAYPFGGYIFVTYDVPSQPTSTSTTYAVWLEYNDSSGLISKKYARYSSSGIVAYNAQLINLTDFARKNQPNNFTSSASFSSYFPTGPSNSLPTSDNELVNKKYVDNQVGSISTVLSSLTTVSGGE